MPHRPSPLLDLPCELRNEVLLHFLDWENVTALIHPHYLNARLSRSNHSSTRVAVTSQKGEGDSIPNGKTSPMSLVCRQLRAEYMELFTKNVLELRAIDEVVVLVRDFNFDIFQDAFVSKLGRRAVEFANKKVPIDVLLEFTESFGDDLLDMNTADRDAAEAMGMRLNVWYKAGRFALGTHTEVQTVINLFKVCLYAGQQDVELDQMIAGMHQSFEAVEDRVDIGGAERVMKIEEVMSGDEGLEDGDDDLTMAEGEEGADDEYAP
ncbi:hypothetical protein LTR62_001753 [Meristemomyces frigidus]|uniref:F-box domain-containing protein n=1 Tax=Meristemomyces frigidus TaxID=1508187 RepID=A0AAN7YQF5_9PEZI|nr:hypothetical protein LTR62_001753 [Meristemomyces frigidus]